MDKQELQKMNTIQLHNGLRIIHMPTQSNVVYCGYAVKAGSRNEKDGEEGLAHFCEHMTFKGTQRLSSLQIINRLELVGGELNAFTTKEDTFYYAAVLKQYFNRAVDLLSDIVFASTYPQHEIEKEMEVVCDEIDSYRDSPAELIYDEMENYIFQGHPLGHNVLGDSDRVRGFNTERCLDFTGRFYRPDNAVFYVVGDIDFSKLQQRLERNESIAAKSVMQSCPSETVASALAVKTEGNNVCGQEIVKDMGTHQAHVMQAVTISEDRDRWRIPLYVTNNILGGPAMNSRLNLSLRERRGLVYTVESVMSNYSDALLWSVYFGCDAHDVKRCQRLVGNELSRLIDKEVSEPMLRKAKQQLKGQLALASENAENFAIDMAKQFLHRGTQKDIKRLCQQIDEVTPHDIHALAETFFQKENFLTLIYR